VFLTAQLATFLVSAFWHGFYAGFYLSFVTFAFCNIVSQMSTKLLRPLFISRDGTIVSRWKSYYDFLTWFLTQCCFYYSAIPFKMYTIDNTLRMWSSVYYVYHVGAALLFVLFLLFGKLLKAYHIDAKRKKE
jgi:lysophospholipid acyltransferase